MTDCSSGGGNRYDALSLYRSSFQTCWYVLAFCSCPDIGENISSSLATSSDGEGLRLVRPLFACFVDSAVGSGWYTQLGVGAGDAGIVTWFALSLACLHQGYLSIWLIVRGVQKRGSRRTSAEIAFDPITGRTACRRGQTRLIENQFSS